MLICVCGLSFLFCPHQHWPVFVEIKDLLTLVPPLVGLKGNLEMTLASRLSTAVSGHLGYFPLGEGNVCTTRSP